MLVARRRDSKRYIKPQSKGISRCILLLPNPTTGIPSVMMWTRYLSLLNAFSHRGTQVVTYLVDEMGIDPQARTQSARTPLHFAVARAQNVEARPLLFWPLPQRERLVVAVGETALALAEPSQHHTLTPHTTCTQATITPCMFRCCSRGMRRRS